MEKLRDSLRSFRIRQWCSGRPDGTWTFSEDHGAF